MRSTRRSHHQGDRLRRPDQARGQLRLPAGGTLAQPADLDVGSHQGRSAIRIRVVFEPVNVPFFPGRPLPELALFVETLR